MNLLISDKNVLRIMLKAFTFLILIGINGQLSAQACCSSGAPVASNLATFSFEGKGLSIRVLNDNIFLNDIVSKSTVLDNSTRKRITRTLMGRVSYTFEQKWSVIGLFPMVWQKEEIRNNGNSFDNSSSGFGDIILIGRYQPIKNFSTGLAFSVGVKFGNGVNDNKDELTGLALNPDLQPGSGSEDGLFIVQFDQVISSDWWIHFFVNYRLTSESSRFNNQLSYKFGNEIQAYFGISKPLVIYKITFSPSIYLRTRYAGYDETNGFKTPNTGGYWFHVMSQLQFDINPQMGFDIRTEFPLYRILDGTQLTTSFGFRLAFYYHVNNQSKPLNEF